MPAPMCNGICERPDFPYKVRGNAKYRDGFMYCSVCRKSIQVDLIKCTCCNCDFRRKPRHGNTRRKILDTMVKRY